MLESNPLKPTMLVERLGVPVEHRLSLSIVMYIVNALALQPSSRNCSPAPDLVFGKLIFQGVLLVLLVGVVVVVVVDVVVVVVVVVVVSLLVVVVLVSLSSPEECFFYRHRYEPIPGAGGRWRERSGSQFTLYYSILS